MMPGMYPHRVSRMLSQNAPPKPTCIKTPSGGSKIAIRIRSKSITIPLGIDKKPFCYQI
jgi:hypothetical protein